MYEPGQGGKLKLLAVEYIALSGPASLQGHLFNFTGRRIATDCRHFTSCMFGPRSTIRQVFSRI
jgi:hypothetical protein